MDRKKPKTVIAWVGGLFSFSIKLELDIISGWVIRWQSVNT